MKNIKLLLFTLCSLISIFSFGQGWEKIFDDGGDEAPLSATQLANGNFIVVGVQNNQPDLNKFFIYQIDQEGNLIWKIYDTHDPQSNSAAFQTITTADGNFLVSISGNLLRKYSPSGQVIWEKPIMDSNPILVESPYGEIFALKRRDHPTLFLDKYDADGNHIWSKEFYDVNPLTLNIEALDMIITSDNSLMITGWVANENNIDLNTFVYKFDLEGEIIWHKEYNNEIHDLGNNIIELPSDEFVIVGGRQGLNEQKVFSFLKINSEGIQISYDTPLDSIDHLIHDCKMTSNGDFLVLSNNFGDQFAGTNGDLFLTKISGDGNLLWNKTYGLPKDEFAFDFFLSSDSGVHIFSKSNKFSVEGDLYLIKTDSLGKSLSNELNGNVYIDDNSDCTFSSNENGLGQIIVKAAKGGFQYYSLTDSLGNFNFILDTGNYEITAHSLLSYWDFCNNNSDITFTTTNDSLNFSIGAQSEFNCPLMSVSIGTPFLRRCFESKYYVEYCNYGTEIAEDAYVEINFDPAMSVQSSSIPIAFQDGNTLTFEVGDVPIGHCEKFNVTILLGDPTNNCDSVNLGATHCVEAYVYPDSLCIPVDNWSGASVEVDGSCQTDSVSFTIQNVGTAPTSAGLEYFVIEDDVILFQAPFSLNPSQVEIVNLPANGSTYRLEAQQEPNHPGMSMPNITIEGCGDPDLGFSFGVFNLFGQDDANPFVDIDCQRNIGSFDPNDKQGFPLGYGEENFINIGQDIEYFIRFQNTGTDTAFRVVIKDTISNLLNVASIQPGVSSHDYKMNITENGTLSFTFDNIMLPDSNINEPGSHGFVKFKISQKGNLPIGSQIFNSAGIYFDFNAPVITNTTLHTVGENFGAVFIEKINKELVTDIKAFPNPFQEFTNIEIWGQKIQNGNFKLFDSVGRLIKTDQINNNSFTFYKNGIPSGIYFFTIEENQKLIGNGKLVIQ